MFAVQLWVLTFLIRFIDAIARLYVCAYARCKYESIVSGTNTLINIDNRLVRECVRDKERKRAGQQQQQIDLIAMY